jgi:HEAT repeat protein
MSRLRDRLRVSRRFGLAGVSLALLLAVGAVLVVVGRDRGQSRFAGLHWPQDRELVFQLQLDTQVTTGSEALVKFQVTGALRLTAVELGPRPVIRAQLDAALAGLEGGSAGGASADPPELQAALRVPHFLDFDGDGGLIGLRAPDGTPDFVLQIWKALAASWQLKTAPGPTRWQVEEDDVAGRYLAEYTISGAQVDKRKLRYVKTFAVVDYAVARSTARFVLDGQRALDRLDSDELLQARAQGPLPAISGSTRISLRRTDVRSAGQRLAWQRAAAEVPRLTLKPRASTEVRRERDRSRIAGRTMPDLLATLHERTATGKRTDELSKEDRDRFGQAYLALTSLLRLSPERVPEAAEHVRAGGPLAITMVGALRDAGSSEAQQALAELVGDKKLPQAVRGEVARSMGVVEQPTPETVDRLRTLRNDPSLVVQAHYSLGSNARRLAGLNPDLAVKVVDELAAKLAGASEADQAMLLIALGNSGHRSALPHVQALLNSPSARVRAAGAQAMRRMVGADVDTLLVGLAADADAEVRTSAVDAISERTPNAVLVGRLSRVIAGDPIFRVRSRAVQTAVAWLDVVPDLKAVLHNAASADSSDDIRLMARAALERQSRTGG